MDASRSSEDKCQDVPLPRRGLQGPVSEDAGVAPAKLEGTLGRLPPPRSPHLRSPRPARPPPSLAAHQAGQSPPRCRWGRLLPVAETDDIFISLSKPPLFMEVSPG